MLTTETVISTQMQAVKKVLAGSRPMDLPQLLRPMGLTQRASWLSLHGVPHFVQACARAGPRGPARLWREMHAAAQLY